MSADDLFDLSALDADSHHAAAAYGLQLGHTDLDPRGVEILEQDLCDVFGEGFKQVEVAAGQHFLEVAHDLGIIQRVGNVVALAGAGVGQGDVQVDLQGLRHDALPVVYAYECVDLEFAQKDDVHCCC